MPDIQMRFGRDMLVVEGGMGTMLARYGFGDDPCPELLNLTEPETIESIHRSFNLAGAECAITNTFGANRRRLESAGLADKVESLNVEGVKRARACRPMHILADMGSCGAEPDVARDIYAEQAEALASADPDAIFIETMSDIDDALCALGAAKSVCDLPVIVSCSFGDDLLMPISRTDIPQAARMLEDAGADVIGMNCILDPAQMRDSIGLLVDSTSLPVLAMPDVAKAVRGPEGTTYPGSPDLMAQIASEFRQLGVQLVGSCCGSTPAYTGAIYASIGGLDPVVR